MPSILLWLILEMSMWSLWSLWRSGYAIRLSLSRNCETVEPRTKPTKPAKRTKRRNRSRRQLQARKRDKRDAMYGRKEPRTPEVDAEADTESSKAACRMKQQQEAFQMLLSSHLVQLVWYQAIVE